jgi:hypothetical protein
LTLSCRGHGDNIPCRAMVCLSSDLCNCLLQRDASAANIFSSNIQLLNSQASSFGRPRTSSLQHASEGEAKSDAPSMHEGILAGASMADNREIGDAGQLGRQPAHADTSAPIVGTANSTWSMQGKNAEEEMTLSNAKSSGVGAQSSSHVSAENHVGGKETGRVHGDASLRHDEDAGGSRHATAAAPLLCEFSSILLQNTKSCHVSPG